MNRKVSVLALLLLASAMVASPYIGLVHAGNGQDKLSIRFQVGESQGEAAPGRVWFSPTSALPPELGGDPNSVHIRGSGWGDDSTGFQIVVDEGGSSQAIFGDADIKYSCSIDLNVFFNSNDATIKVHEMWQIKGRGYIETLAVESLYNLNTPDYYGRGTFVGHGEIDGQKINLSGEAGTGLTGPFRIGTVMGWPT